MSTDRLQFACKLLAITGASFAILRIAAIYLGIASPINDDIPNLSAPGLLTAVLWHVILGALLFFGVVASGLAVLSFVPKRWALIPTDRLMLSLPAGLFLWLVTCVAVRMNGGGSFVVLGLISGLILLRLSSILRTVTGNRSAATAIVLGRNWRILAFVGILGASLAAHFGILWRIPSDRLSGTIDLGDLVFYVASYHSLKGSIYPYLLQAVEGEHFTYFNMLGPLLAFAFDELPGFEVSLFLTTSVTVFFFFGLSYAVACLYHYRTTTRSTFLSPGTICTLALLVCAATYYPSWIVETPPYAFAAPLTLMAVYLVERGNQRIEFFYVLIPVIVVSFAITKVMPVTVFGGYALYCFWVKARQDRSKAALLILSAGAVLIGIFCLLLLNIYGKKFFSFAQVTDFGPTSAHTFYHQVFVKGTHLWKAIKKTFPAFSMELGFLLLPLAAARFRNLPVFLGALSGVFCYFFYSYIFIPTAASAFFLVAGWLILNPLPEGPKRKGTLVFLSIAALLVLCSQYLRDPGGWGLALIWQLTVGSVVIVLLSPKVMPESQGNPRSRGASLGNAWRYAFAVAAAISVVAATTGDLRFGGEKRQIISQNLYDLWKNVRQITPPDALIFTDQVDNTESRLLGWNDLSLISERQFYFSSWQTSVLRGDPTGRSHRLLTNTKVLSGELSPGQLTYHRPYSAYFAAVRSSYPVPKSFKLVYGNDDYSIYRIP